MTRVRYYWNRQVFSGGKIGPQRLDDDEAVVEAVAAEKGAIGYVTTKPGADSGVKVIVIKD